MLSRIALEKTGHFADTLRMLPNMLQSLSCLGIWLWSFVILLSDSYAAEWVETVAIVSNSGLHLLDCAHRVLPIVSQFFLTTSWSALRPLLRYIGLKLLVRVPGLHVRIDIICNHAVAWPASSKCHRRCYGSFWSEIGKSFGQVSHWHFFREWFRCEWHWGRWGVFFLHY